MSGFLWLSIPLHGLTLAGILAILRLVRKLTRIEDQHNMMWYEYAEKHSIPIDTNFRVLHAKELGVSNGD